MAFEEVTIGDARLICADFRDVLPTLGIVDAVVTDPPYGIGEAAGKNQSRNHRAIATDYGDASWDDEPLDQAWIDRFRAISRYQIIFGGNYYTLPPTSCWLVWDKLNGQSDFADCELAWTNLPKAVRRICWHWNGMMRKDHEQRFHPTQKPLGVMQWCLTQLPPTTRSLLDPLMGSGTTGVACALAGMQFIGIERERVYFDTTCQRVEAAYKQLDMFVPRSTPAPPTQAALF